MTLKFLTLLICCLTICEVLSATTVQSPPQQRRPNEFLQPPPPPPPPSSRRQPPNARPRNFRVNPASSGATPRSPSTATVNHIPLSGPNAGGSKQVSSGSTTRLNKVPPAGSQRIPGGSSGNAGRIQIQSPREALQKTNSSNNGNASNIVVGRVHRPSSGGTQEKQRVARWFLSRPVVDSEAQPSRTQKAILRPPPGPANYNQVPLQPPPPPHTKQSSSATHIHPQFHLPPPPPPPRSQHHKSKDCNPCNKIPWIPIPRAITHDNTAPGHSQGASNAYLPPAPSLSSQYELPSVGSLPLQSPSAAEHYGPPVSSFSATFSSPQDQYSPPPPPVNLLDDQFRPPPLAQTLSSQYGAPFPELGSSHSLAPSDEYGPPPPPPSSFGHSIKVENSPQLAPSYLPAAPVYEPASFDDVPSSGRGHNGGSSSYIKQNFGPEHPSISVEQTHPQIQESHHLESLPDQQQSYSNAQTVEHPVSYTSQQSGNADNSNSNGNDGGGTSVDIVKSVPILEDSHPVASQHPAPTAIYTSQPSEQVGSETSHPNKEQTSVTGSNNIGFEQQQYEYNQQQDYQQQQYYPQQQHYNQQQQQQYNPQQQKQQQQQYQQEHQNYNEQQNHQQIQQQQYQLQQQHQYQQPHYNQQQQHNLINSYAKPQDHVRNGNQQSSLEIIPSIPVIDYLSSIEYPLQIIQSPFIDVTEAPDPPAVQGTKEGTIEGFDNHGVSTSYSTSSGSWSSINGVNANSSKVTDNGEGEIIVGKPTLKASTLNVSFSEARDQKLSATNLKNHNLEARPIVVDYPTNIGLHEGSSSSLEDHKETPSKINLDVTGSNNIKQEFAPPSAKDTFNIQSSIQTGSEEGNSLIHQINTIFESHKTTAETSPPFSQNSNYVLFQNFPQPPIGYLPPDVLQQKLPPPTPFQSTIKHTSHITTPRTPTSTFGHSLKLEAPISFLNPPPRNSHESYTTVSNTPAPPSNTFWTPPPGKFLSTPISPSAETTSLAWGTSTTTAPFKISNPNIINAFAEAAGLLPPPPAPPSQVPNKKPKQIQIIVPYTSSKDLMQFQSFTENKSPVTDSTGWQPMLTTPAENIPIAQQGRKVPPSRDYHENQESRTVTAKTPPSDSTYNELQHIFAKNIRDLLRGEQDNNGNVNTTPNTLRLQDLQKNIDEWTALEYSKRRNTARQNKIKDNTIVEAQKATTSSATSFQHFLVPSKQIPEEYLTTTPSVFDDIQTTENSIATAFPRLRKYENYSTTSSPTSTARLSNSFYDHEASGSQRHSIRTAVKSNGTKSDRTGEDDGAATFLIDTPPNHQRKLENHKWKIIESNYILPEAIASQSALSGVPSTSTTSTTTTTVPTTTALPWEDATEAHTTTTRTTTWEKLPLSISPFTNEKVYVVTPVTTERTTTSTTPSTTTTTAPQWRGNSRYSTSINDIFPFRNGPPKAERLIATTSGYKDDTYSTKADSAVTFRSPRFSIRPTPGAPLQRSFTISSDSVGERTSRHAGGRSLKLESASLNEIKVSDLKNKTVPGTTTKRPFLDVFLGLTDLPTYTPPNGTKVETLTGHSKVITVATQPTVPTPLHRRAPAQNSKKTTSTSGNGITKLFLVSASTTAAPSTTTTTTTTASSHPKPRGGVTSRNGTRWVTSKKELSSSWQFPDLSKEESESVEAADLELKKEKRL